MLKTSAFQKPKKQPAAEPIAEAQAATAPSFDFVKFERHVEQKSPQATGKKWRAGQAGKGGEAPAFPTRKKYFDLKQFFSGANKTSAFVAQSKPTAELLRDEVGGERVDAAYQCIALGKVKDTQVFRGHLKVLATAQKKFEAKQVLCSAQAELDVKAQSLTQDRQQLQADCQTVVHDLEAFQDEMRTVRERAVAAKRRLATGPDKLAHENAQQRAAGIQQQVVVPRQPAPSTGVAPTAEPVKHAEKKLGALKKLQKTVKKQLLGDRKTLAAAVASSRAAVSSKKAADKAPVLVDKNLLLELIHAEAEKTHEKPEAVIESMLMDDALLSGYLASPVFDALMELYDNLQTSRIQAYWHEGSERLALTARAAEVKELTDARDRAKREFDGIAVPK